MPPKRKTRFSSKAAKKMKQLRKDETPDEKAARQANDRKRYRTKKCANSSATVSETQSNSNSNFNHMSSLETSPNTQPCIATLYNETNNLSPNVISNISPSQNSSHHNGEYVLANGNVNTCNNGRPEWWTLISPRFVSVFGEDDMPLTPPFHNMSIAPHRLLSRSLSAPARSENFICGLYSSPSPSVTSSDNGGMSHAAINWLFQQAEMDGVFDVNNTQSSSSTEPLYVVIPNNDVDVDVDDLNETTHIITPHGQPLSQQLPHLPTISVTYPEVECADFVVAMTNLHQLVKDSINKGRHCHICNRGFPSLKFSSRQRNMCESCEFDKSNPPRFSTQNRMNPGTRPEFFKLLTVAEQMLISPIISSFCVFSLAGQGQRGYRGHVINFQQDVDSFVSQLPRTTLPVVLVQRKIGEKSVLLRVRRALISKCLAFLKCHNRFFKDIYISQENLKAIPVDGFWTADELLLNDVEVAAVHEDTEEAVPVEANVEAVENEEIPDSAANLQNETQTYTTSGLMTTALKLLNSELRERLLAEKVQFPAVTNPQPVNEFTRQGYISLTFPHLFPTGEGDYSLARTNTIFLGDYMRHLLMYKDDRFRRDARFPFFACNTTQRWRALSGGRIYLKQHPNEAALSAAEIRQRLQVPEFIKNVQAYSGSIRGTQAYWIKKRGEVEAMVQQLGMPTFFVTLSAADIRWPELKDFWMVSQEEMRAALVADPAVADWFFTSRFEIFLREFFGKRWNVLDSWFRVEYQSRGSPHVHGLLWLPGAPNILDVNVDLIEAAAFYDKFISAQNPFPNIGDFQNFLSDAHPCEKKYSEVIDRQRDLGELVNMCHLHTRCMVGRCLKNGKCRFGYPKKFESQTVLTRDPISGKISFSLKRNHCLVNPFNAEILSSWRANNDIQPVLSKDDLLFYILKYVAKPETSSTDLRTLSHVASMDVPTDSARRAVQQTIMSTFASRDFSAQEVAHLVLGLPLTFSSRHFLNVNTSGIRAVNESGALSNLIDRYAKRPHHFESITLWTFCTRHIDSQRKTHINEVSKPCILVVKPRLTRNPDNAEKHEAYCRQQALLFVPWRGKVDSLLPTPTTKWSDIIQDLPLQPVRFLEVSADEVTAVPPQPEGVPAPVVQVNEPVSPSDRQNQETWMEVTADVQVAILNVEVPDEIVNDENVDWSALNTEFQFTNDTDFSSFIDVAKQGNSIVDIPVVDICLLNDKQNEVYEFVKAHWDICKQHNNQLEPIRVIVQGYAGTGKSYLIHCVRQLLGSSVAVLAPTGVAANNIFGSTIHSYLQIPCHHNFAELDGEPLNQLQVRLSGIKYIIVDEMSMIGRAMFGKMDSRFRQAFPGSSQKVFGNVSILIFGDFAQLAPVKDLPLYRVSTPLTSKQRKNMLSLNGHSAYTALRTFFILDQVVRQQNDTTFQDVLSRARNGTSTEEDWNLLMSRNCQQSDNLVGFENALSLFAIKDEAALCNRKYLLQLQQPIARIEATHVGGFAAERASKDDAGGLSRFLLLAVGARVMLSCNLWIQQGLVNGAMGTVKAICYEIGSSPPKLPSVVFVEFDRYNGPNVNGCVPIVPHQSQWHDRKGFRMRRQIPLNLAWAVTVHKAQGLTLDKAIVNIGYKEFSAGLTYVSLSRTRALADLLLQPFDFQRIRNLHDNKAVQDRINEETRLRRLAS